MKQGISYTVDLNIAFIFIVIVFTFMSAVIIFFKSTKINNAIASSIEKYEGFNALAVEEINGKITSLGYQTGSISCGGHDDGNCNTEPELVGNGSNGYCIYYCQEKIDGSWYYYYKIRTRLMINFPIIGKMFDVKAYSNTVKMYDFEQNRLGG